MNFGIGISRNLIRRLEDLHNHVLANKYLYELYADSEIFLSRGACQAVVDRIYAGEYACGSADYCGVSWQIVDPTKPMIMEVTGE